MEDVKTIDLGREPRSPADVFKNPSDIQALKERIETLELAVSYAQDLVNMWPTVTMRTLGNVTNKIKALKEAIDLAKR